MHNHPSGDPKPSRDDIEMTREVKTAAAGMATVLYIGLEPTVAVVTDVTMPKVLPGRFAPDIAHFLEAEGRLLEMGIREHREAARQS